MTAKTVSESIHSLSETNDRVVTGTCPFAADLLGVTMLVECDGTR
ncbi:hypothetical protein HEP87_58655 [Streptomyces sp. S1D4-11]|nr:hypothetical protein [Streptomyces sp. S1D4-11]